MNDKEMNDYFEGLNDVLTSRNLKTFWIKGVKTLKPLKKSSGEIIKSKKDILEYIKKNKFKIGSYVTCIQISISSRIKKLKLDDNDAFSIIINIGQINKDYSLSLYSSNVILYTKKELFNNQFSLKELKKMIDSTYEKTVISNVSGVSYTTWKKRT
jgi:hypothetical protein